MFWPSAHWFVPKYDSLFPIMILGLGKARRMPLLAARFEVVHSACPLRLTLGLDCESASDMRLKIQHPKPLVSQHKLT